MQTAKRLVKTKNLTEALKDYRSTALEVTGYAPCQLLMGRMIRTSIPLADDLMAPSWPNMEEVRKRDGAAKEKYADNFNRRHGARKLPEIPPDAMVRERKPNEKNWSDPLSVENKISKTKYTVRNRRHLQLCPAAARRFTESRGEQSTVPAKEAQEEPHHSPPRPAPAASATTSANQTNSGRLVKPVQRYGSFIS